MRLYIAGPMSGIKAFNFPAFDAAAKQLETEGYSVVSPAEIDSPEMRAACLASAAGDLADLPPGESYGALLGRDIEIVIDEVDGVMVLPGWSNSRGARIEVFTAVQMSKPIFYYMRWIGRPSLEGAELSTAEINEGLGGGIAVLQSRVEQTDESAIDRIAEEQTKREREAREGGYTPPIETVTMIGGEVRTTSATGGEKGVKPERLDLIPPGFLEELGRVYGRGAAKYSDNNYLRGFEWRKSMGASQRHYLKWAGGEDYDEETGCHHLVMVAWHMAALYTFQTEGLGTDDRIFHTIAENTEAGK